MVTATSVAALFKVSRLLIARERFFSFLYLEPGLPPPRLTLNQLNKLAISPAVTL